MLSQVMWVQITFPVLLQSPVRAKNYLFPPSPPRAAEGYLVIRSELLVC